MKNIVLLIALTFASLSQAALTKIPASMVKGAAGVVGRLVYTGTTNCQWSGSSTALASYAADTDCASPAIVGSLTAPATKIPAAIVATGNAGVYKITATGLPLTSPTSGAAACFWKLFDGATYSGTLWVGDATTNLTGGALIGSFTYSSSISSKQFEIRYMKNSGTANCLWDSQNTSAPLEITVEYFPPYNP